MVESFEEKYGIEKKNDASKFLFSESSETDKAETKIIDSVKIFVNNLNWIEPWLTEQLLNVFKNFQDNPNYSWLSESDLRLHSLGKLYETNKIPSPLEKILNEMISLLTQYKSVRMKSKTLEEMMRTCVDFEKEEKEKSNPGEGSHWTIKHTSSTNWWRWNI